MHFTLLPVNSNKKIYHSLKNGRVESINNLISSGYDDDSRRQILLECILKGNSRLYLGKVYTEEQIKNLVLKK